MIDTVKKVIAAFRVCDEFIETTESEDHWDYINAFGEFEDVFRPLICEIEGHRIAADQCGKPAHDYCLQCNQLRVDIESKERSDER